MLSHRVRLCTTVNIENSKMIKAFMLSPEALDATFYFSFNFLYGAGLVLLFFFFLLFFLSPRHNTVHRVRVDLLEGSRGSNWKLSNRIFLALRAQERVLVFKNPFCWNCGRCNHSDGEGHLGCSEKWPRAKEGVMGCDRWGGYLFKRGEELQRLNPSNSARRPAARLRQDL